jgi:hypothetical protein
VLDEFRSRAEKSGTLEVAPGRTLKSTTKVTRWGRDHSATYRKTVRTI